MKAGSIITEELLEVSRSWRDGYPDGKMDYIEALGKSLIGQLNSYKIGLITRLKSSNVTMNYHLAL